MPKNTVYNGYSNEVAGTGHGQHEQGGDPTSATTEDGTGYSESTERQPTSSAQEQTSSATSVQRTGNHSAPDPTENSTADSTATDPVPVGSE